MWRVVLTVFVLCWGSDGRTVCRDKNGAEVDWYILYKVPKLNNEGLSGLEYFYIDSTKTEWPGLINDTNGVLARTLQPLLTYKSPTSDFGFISYNDQPPNMYPAPPAFGHSKGVVMMDKSTGVWLLHSTPRFPWDRNQGKFWPETPREGRTNAQIFICVTFAYGQFEQIGKHLLYIRAFPFDAYIPNNFYPVLRDVVNQADIKPDSPFLVQDLKSSAGQKFRSFAKYSTDKYNVKDLYLLIADNLNSDLAVQTWRGSTEDKESDFSEEGMVDCSDGSGEDCLEEGRVDCSDGSGEDCLEEGRVDCSEGGRNIYTIGGIEMIREVKKVSWINTHDHSKWCVTEDQNKPWTCIADLNRELSQYKRPGGALCMENTRLWREFKGFIKNKKVQIGHISEANRPTQGSIVKNVLILLPSILIIYVLYRYFYPFNFIFLKKKRH